MRKELRNALLLAIGAGSIAKSKVEEATEAFVKDNRLSSKEGEKLVRDVVKQGIKKEKEMIAYVEKRVMSVGSKVMKKAGRAKKKLQKSAAKVRSKKKTRKSKK